MEKYHLQGKTPDGDILIYLETLINGSKIITFVIGDDAQYCLGIKVSKGVCSFYPFVYLALWSV